MPPISEYVMHEIQRHIEATESAAACAVPRIPKLPITWSMTAKATPHKPSEFESVLLAIAGHDLRQPLQVLQNAREFLGRGVRTRSELRLLRLVQSAIDRLRDQLDELVTAHRFGGGAKGMKLTSVPVGPLLQQATYENEFAALVKGVSVRTIPTGATIESDAPLLGTVLRNLVNNAVKYTEPGGRVLAGCRHTDQSIRIDVYDTGIGITGDQMPRMFEAFTRFDPARCDGLGIGLFIVRQAIGILGHRIDSLPLPVAGPAFHFREPGRVKVRKPSSRSKDRKIASEIILPVPLTPASKLVRQTDSRPIGRDGASRISRTDPTSSQLQLYAKENCHE
jgi:two-component system phosphate regulon sensor histidine kinase PhoR